jgi:hypothetical protein
MRGSYYTMLAECMAVRDQLRIRAAEMRKDGYERYADKLERLAAGEAECAAKIERNISRALQALGVAT